MLKKNLLKKDGYLDFSWIKLEKLKNMFDFFVRN